MPENVTGPEKTIRISVPGKGKSVEITESDRDDLAEMLQRICLLEGNPFAMAIYMVRVYEPIKIAYAMYRLKNYIANSPKAVGNRVGCLRDILNNRIALPAISEGGDEAAFKENYTIRDWKELALYGRKPNLRPDKNTMMRLNDIFKQMG